MCTCKSTREGTAAEPKPHRSITLTLKMQAQDNEVRERKEQSVR